mmetsp:Transcript_24894/g.64837  ORF Transcript_24894/g.64837 Transcript_24894/m.64837 type:complete len:470 (+) Transcript_24894:306-1715(+)
MGKGAKKKKAANQRKRAQQAAHGGGVSGGGAAAASDDNYGPSGRRRKGKKGRKNRNYSGGNGYVSFREQLKRKGFRLQVCAADGNCFFRAVGQQLGKEHSLLRKETCDYIEDNEEVFRPFCEDEDESFEEYLKGMRASGEWAGQPEMMAVSWGKKVSMWVHQIEPEPTYLIDSGDPSAKIIHISYHEGIHFNAVYPNAEADQAVAKILAAGPAAADGDGGDGGGATDARPAVAGADIETYPSEDEDLVLMSTACNDILRARQALATAGGDAAIAIESIIAEDAADALDIEMAQVAAAAAAASEGVSAAAASQGEVDAMLVAALAESVEAMTAVAAPMDDSGTAPATVDADGGAAPPNLADAPDVGLEDGPGRAADGDDSGDGSGHGGDEAAENTSQQPKANGTSRRPRKQTKRDKKRDKKLRKQEERRAALKAIANGEVAASVILDDSLNAVAPPAAVAQGPADFVIRM